MKSEVVWYFIGAYIINRTLHGCLEIRNSSSCIEKYFTHSLRSLVQYFSTLEEKFRISQRPYPLYIINKILYCGWSSMCLFLTKLQCSHLGVQLQLCNISTFLNWIAVNWTPTLCASQSGALKWVLLCYFSAGFKLGKKYPRHFLMK